MSQESLELYNSTPRPQLSRIRGTHEFLSDDDKKILSGSIFDYKMSKTSDDKNATLSKILELSVKNLENKANSEGKSQEFKMSRECTDMFVAGYNKESVIHKLGFSNVQMSSGAVINDQLLTLLPYFEQFMLEQDQTSPLQKFVSEGFIEGQRAVFFKKSSVGGKAKQVAVGAATTGTPQGLLSNPMYTMELNKFMADAQVGYQQLTQLNGLNSTSSSGIALYVSQVADSVRYKINTTRLQQLYFAIMYQIEGGDLTTSSVLPYGAVNEYNIGTASHIFDANGNAVSGAFFAGLITVMSEMVHKAPYLMNGLHFLGSSTITPAILGASDYNEMAIDFVTSDTGKPTRNSMDYRTLKVLRTANPMTNFDYDINMFATEDGEIDYDLFFDKSLLLAFPETKSPMVKCVYGTDATTRYGSIFNFEMRDFTNSPSSVDFFNPTICMRASMNVGYAVVQPELVSIIRIGAVPI